MVSVLILTHGCLARELLGAARRIAGDLSGFEALCLDWDEPPEAAQARTQAVVSKLDQGAGVLILTDVFGGTPHNVARWLCGSRRAIVVSGVNLPMVLRLGCSKTSKDRPLDELAECIAARGRASIQLCGATLKRDAKPQDTTTHGPPEQECCR